jgi:hypothetical protein
VDKVVLTNETMVISGSGFSSDDVTELGGSEVENTYDSSESTLTIQLSDVDVDDEKSNLNLIINGIKEFSVYFPNAIAGDCPCDEGWARELANLSVDSLPGECVSVLGTSFTGTVTDLENDPSFFSFGVTYDVVNDVKECNLITFDKFSNNSLPNPFSSSVILLNTINNHGAYLGCKNKIKELICYENGI